MTKAKKKHFYVLMIIVVAALMICMPITAISAAIAADGEWWGQWCVWRWDAVATA